MDFSALPFYRQKWIWFDTLVFFSFPVHYTNQKPKISILTNHWLSILTTPFYIISNKFTIQKLKFQSLLQSLTNRPRQIVYIGLIDNAESRSGNILGAGNTPHFHFGYFCVKLKKIHTFIWVRATASKELERMLTPWSEQGQGIRMRRSVVTWLLLLWCSELLSSLLFSMA